MTSLKGIITLSHGLWILKVIFFQKMDPLYKIQKSGQFFFEILQKQLIKINKNYNYRNN